MTLVPFSFGMRHQPAHQVHGLGTDHTKPDWPTININDIQRLSSFYPQFGSSTRLVWHSPRPFSSAAIMRDKHATNWFVKRHDMRLRSPRLLQAEHAFMHHLRKHGQPVPDVLKTRQGHSAVAFGGFTYEIHAIGNGRDIYRQQPSWTPPESHEHAFAMGAMLARLHQASISFHHPQRPTFLLVSRDDLVCAHDPLAELHKQFSLRPALAHYPANKDVARTLEPLLMQQQAIVNQLAVQPRLWTHNDWHASNLLWSDNQISGIIDFGLCAPTFTLNDLAIAIERNAIAWLQLPRTSSIAHTPIAIALIQGYASIRTLKANDLALLARLLPIVHLDFALSEIEYFIDIVKSPQRADIAWHDFLLAHATWFESIHGKNLLTNITNAL